MIITPEINNSFLTLRLEGRMDSLSSDDVLARVNELLAPEHAGLIFDFEKVDFISSNGLRVLIAAHRMLEGRPLRVINANESVEAVLGTSGLRELFLVPQAAAPDGQ